jgi:putative copper export protein
VGSGARLLLGTPPAAILASDYGRLLLLKSALVLIVLTIGARQRKRITRGEKPAVRAVRVECAVAAAVLVITAALTGSEPPAAD